jgi:hypothetical protein
MCPSAPLLLRLFPLQTPSPRATPLPGAHIPLSDKVAPLTRWHFEYLTPLTLTRTVLSWTVTFYPCILDEAQSQSPAPAPQAGLQEALKEVPQAAASSAQWQEHGPLGTGTGMWC